MTKEPIHNVFFNIAGGIGVAEVVVNNIYYIYI